MNNNNKEIRIKVKELGYGYEYIPRFRRFVLTKDDEWVETVNHNEKVKLEELGLKYYETGMSWGFERDE